MQNFLFKTDVIKDVTTSSTLIYFNEVVYFSFRPVDFTSEVKPSYLVQPSFLKFIFCC